MHNVQVEEKFKNLKAKKQDKFALQNDTKFVGAGLAPPAQIAVNKPGGHKALPYTYRCCLESNREAR